MYIFENEIQGLRRAKIIKKIIIDGLRRKKRIIKKIHETGLRILLCAIIYKQKKRHSNV